MNWTFSLTEGVILLTAGISNRRLYLLLEFPVYLSRITLDRTALEVINFTFPLIALAIAISRK